MEFYADQSDGDILVLVADGGLNADSAEEFITPIEKLVDSGCSRLIIDCSGLRTISSYGLGLLIRLHKHMRERGGDVKVCAVRGLVAQVMQATRLDHVFDLYPDVNRARLAFRRTAGGAS